MHVNTRYQWFIGLCTNGVLWWSSCTLYLHACQVRVTVGYSSLCCCTCVYVFPVLPNSFVCWSNTHTHTLSLSHTHIHTHSMYWLVHALDADGQVLGHDTRLDGLYAHCLQRLSEVGQLCIAVQLGSVGQTPRPCKNGSCRQPHTNLPFLN